jgi:hypothetical protein
MVIAMLAGALELDRGLDEVRRAAAGELRMASVDATERLRDMGLPAAAALQCQCRRR